MVSTPVERNKVIDLASWALIASILALLAFVSFGPFLHDPRVNGIIEDWRSHYFPAVTFATFGFAWLFQFGSGWREFSQTDDPYRLFLILVYGAIAITLAVLLALGF